MIDKLFGFACCFALSSCALPSHSADRDKIACSILASFVTSEFNRSKRPLFLAPGPVGSSPRNQYDDLDGLADYILQHQETDLTRQQILLRLREEKRLSTISPVDACPKIKLIKKERSFFPPPRAENEPPETTPGGLFYQYDTLSVGMPFVDLERGEAEFEVSRVCGPLCGSGAIVIYKLNKNRNWVKASELGTWIS